MRKAIFLEYKLGDYDTSLLYSSGANEVIVWMENLNPSRLKQLQKWGISIHLCFSAFTDGLCPLDPASRTRLETLTRQAIELNPHGIIFDHFRFRGRWEGVEKPDGPKTFVYKDSHSPCNYCRDKNKSSEIATIAQWITQKIGKNIQTGYYAVPILAEEVPSLGQDHQLLAKYFDYISPMLYHRMINKPVSYISEFTRQLSVLTGKPVLPIVQAKDMPDSLPDGVTAEILRQEFTEATKPPSAGVAWFSWDGAVEKHKTQTIAKIWADA